MTHGALDDGADDIDVVLPYGALLAGESPGPPRCSRR
jgi:deoxyribose-phosphate aldolase